MNAIVRYRDDADQVIVMSVEFDEINESDTLYRFLSDGRHDLKTLALVIPKHSLIDVVPVVPTATKWPYPK